VAKEQLRNLVESSDYVLVLGAGFSKESGLPLWAESLIEIANKLAPLDELYSQLIKHETARERYLIAAQQFYISPIDSTTRHRILQEVFGYEGPITARQKHLLRTPCLGIVTTNFDRNVERAAREANVDLVHFTESDGDLCQARVCERPFSVRLHGRIESPEGLVFAQSHYDIARDRAEYQSLFREIFVSRNVVFFGFSFADPLIKNHVKEMSKAVHAVFARKAFALFSSQPSADVATLLREACITPVIYDDANRHDEAWRLLSFTPRDGEVPTIEKFHTQRVKSELAAVYARSRSKGHATDRIQVMSGMLVPLLATLGVGSECDIGEFEDRARKLLALPNSVPRSDLSEATLRLEHDGLIRLNGSILVVLSLGDQAALGKDLDALVSGFIARAEIRYGFKIEQRDAATVAELLTAILAVNGLHIAHSVIRRRPLNQLDLSDAIERAGALVRLPDRLRVPAFMQALLQFMTHADREEERLLGELASLTFVTSLLVVDPVLSATIKSGSLPEVYLDASVVLPWLATGHPLGQAYGQMIAGFGAGRAMVIPDYINEVVSHRRLAIEAVAEGGLDDHERFERYVMMFEASGVNAYLGGYAGMRGRGFKGTFADYLKAHAPFETEPEAAAFLGRRGITVVEAAGFSQVEGGSVMGELRAAFRERSRGRTELVISHDAQQLDVLLARRPRRECPYFVTADKTLLGIIPETRARGVLNRMLLPQQAAYLADLMSGTTTTMTGFTRALWSAPRDLAGRVRDYYIDRVLREYEYVLLEDLSKVVEIVMAEIEKDSTMTKEMDDWADTERHRLKMFKLMDRFEPKFYETMLDAKKKAGL
jgi:hypothetical protein